MLEFCLAIPRDQYLRGGVDRFLARRVLADRLPAEVTGNRGRRFQCAEFFHRMGGMREMLAEGVEDRHDKGIRWTVTCGITSRTNWARWRI